MGIYYWNDYYYSYYSINSSGEGYFLGSSNWNLGKGLSTFPKMDSAHTGTLVYA